MPEPMKVSFNMPQDEIDRVRDIARRRGVPVTQVLREACALRVYVDRMNERDRLVIEHPDRSRSEVVLGWAAC